MPRRGPIPDLLTLGPFVASEASAAGMPRSRLRADDLQHPHHGLYTPARENDDLVSRCEDLCPLLARDQWFSHLTAARLWGMPLPFRAREDEPLHTLALADTAPIRRDGVVGWETEDEDVDRRLLGLLPVIAPAEVWCQLGVPGATGRDADTGARRSLSKQWLVAVADYLLSGPRRDGRRHPLCTTAELSAAVRKRRGRRGVVALTAALAQARFPVDSPMETLLRLGLVACGLPEPAVQVPVMTAAGLRHADLGYPDERVLLDFQGDDHRTVRARWLDDLTRVQLFEDAGYRLIQVGAQDVVPDCSALAARIRRALARG